MHGAGAHVLAASLTLHVFSVPRPRAANNLVVQTVHGAKGMRQSVGCSPLGPSGRSSGGVGSGTGTGARISAGATVPSSLPGRLSLPTFAPNGLPNDLVRGGGGDVSSSSSTIMLSGRRSASVRTFDDMSGQQGSVRVTMEVLQGDLKQLKRLGEGEWEAPRPPTMGWLMTWGSTVGSTLGLWEVLWVVL